MKVTCDLEVDVNGEEIFLVSKEILSSFSGRLRKLFNKPSDAAATKVLKVIFHDLPGGPEAFELMTRFCYSNGGIQITPTNTCVLHCIAQFMEMSEDVSSSPNLIELTEKSLEGILYWTWSEIVNALKQCQDFFPAANSSGIVDKILETLVGRITTASDTSPTGSSPESFTFRFSCDTRSTVSTKNSNYRVWWFEDLVVLNSDSIKKIIKSMVSQKVDHATVSRFLFYYIKCKFSNATSDEKKKCTEVVVDLLYSLDRSSVSCKSLFGILRISSSLNLSKCCRSRLESMIGSQLDQATLDNLLVPAPAGMESIYDVNLVLRFVKSFLSAGGQASVTRLKQVGSLIDLYLAEVAPDSCLKPPKFIALTIALPDAARDSHDAMYQAIVIYLEVHAQLSEEEKMNICCAINCEKLSVESCKHLAWNSKVPKRTAVQALISQQLKLKSLLEDTNHLKSFSSPLKGNEYEKNQCDDGEQIILYAKKLNLPMENEKLKAHLQGMQCRVMELEKICKKMRTQMAKIMKTEVSSPGSSRSVPRLCS
ncbi:BTB/POZ domain-containing protein At3g22104-like [Phoenix dactylifera]|uniref:BTB/POZ domain-containing protein At3g22104-like n=1 Tax=Phoenix dactylifera TaxID=42345 RepID=A0A8B7CEA6_PHODC|nr:BTB/POZ domain-containing protein At3g22104-like [Phoenix dactylifera]